MNNPTRHPQVLYIYAAELLTQCTYAVNAIRGLGHVLEKLNASAGIADDASRTTLHAEAMRSVHSFLTHASNVSRLLWPAPPRHLRKPQKGEHPVAFQRRLLTAPSIARSRALRRRLGLLHADSPLRSRKLRDHLEHFDDRLDEWAEAARSDAIVWIDNNIGDLEQMVQLPGRPHPMRNFNPATGIFTFRSESYNLVAMRDGLVDIANRARSLRTELLTRLKHEDRLSGCPIRRESQ